MKLKVKKTTQKKQPMREQLPFKAALNAAISV